MGGENGEHVNEYAIISSKGRCTQCETQGNIIMRKAIVSADMQNAFIDSYEGMPGGGPGKKYL